MRAGSWWLLLSVVAVGCSEPADERAAVLSDDGSDPVAILGVPASEFQCASVAPTSAIAEIVGAPVVERDASFEPPTGVPRPCNYATADDAQARYSFDLDCRPGALDEGARLMAHYAVKPDSVPLRIGQSGLDHSGASLLFIDDDADCYVRVLGPDADVRRAIAELVATGLTERSAPSGYRYGP